MKMLEIPNLRSAAPGAFVAQADSYEILASLDDDAVDVILTDPPYDDHVHETHSHRQSELGYRVGIRNGFRADTQGGEAIPFDALNGYEWVSDALRVTKRWVLCFCALEQYGAYRDAAGDAYIRSCFWRKPNGVPQFTGDRPGQPGEGIATMHKRGGKLRWNGKGRHGYFDVNNPTQAERELGGHHTTQKPLELCIKLVELFSEPDELILDPFCGSGSMGVAALLLGRRYIGLDNGSRRSDGRPWADLAESWLRSTETGVTTRQADAGQIGMFP